jgi:hypothetical protein
MTSNRTSWIKSINGKAAVTMRRWFATGVIAVILSMVGTVVAPSLAAAHGAVAIEDDICVRRVGGSMVHFAAYQPQLQPKAEYCTEIPGEGDTFLVIDLVDHGLRNTPVGVRIVKGVNEKAEDQTVAYWQPASHPDGVVRGEAKLDKGLYKLIITAEGSSPSYYLLRVQQIDYSKIARNAVGPLTGLLLLALVVYELSKSRRMRSWWASRRT